MKHILYFFVGLAIISILLGIVLLAVFEGVIWSLAIVVGTITVVCSYLIGRIIIENIIKWRIKYEN